MKVAIPKRFQRGKKAKASDESVTHNSSADDDGGSPTCAQTSEPNSTAASSAEEPVPAGRKGRLANSAKRQLGRLRAGASTARAQASRAGKRTGAQLKDVGRTAYVKSAALVQKGKDEVVGLVQSTVDSVLDYALDYAGEVVKSSIKDPLMPRWVKDGLDDAVDDVWPDVKEETKTMVFHGLHTAVPVEDEPATPCCPNPLAAVRSFLLYHMLPYDKTFWGCIRDPVWLILKLISMVPVFGVAQFFFFILFLLIDKTDEYQLVSFILRFKSIQFITMGVISALVASVQFYYCATQVDNCEKNAPGEPLWLFVVFVAQVMLTWTAFVLLPCSHKRGVRPLVVRGAIMRRYDRDGDGVLNADEIRRYNRRRTDARRKLMLAAKDASCSAADGSEQQQSSGSGSQEDCDTATDTDETYTWDEGNNTYATTTYADDGAGDVAADEPSEYDPQPCCCCTCFPQRGGRLRHWVWYDTVIFVIAVAIMVVPMYVGPTKVSEGNPLRDNWRFRATLYYCKIFYGLFSLPFVIFSLPLCTRILTHASNTGYNRAGQAVPMRKPPVQAEPDIEVAQKATARYGKLRQLDSKDASGSKSS